MPNLVKTYGDIRIVRVEHELWRATVPLAGDGYVRASGVSEEIAVLRLISRLARVCRDHDIETVVNG